MPEKLLGMFVAATFCFLSSRFALADAYGNAFRVNATTAGRQALRSAAAGANGDVAVLWSDGGSESPVYLQRYDALGRALQGGDWVVSAGTTDIALDGTGAYAILRRASDGSSSGVFATVYNRNGSILVPEFRVNDVSAEQQTACSIAMNVAGQFVVSWLHQPMGSGNYLYVTRYQRNGVRVGTPIFVRSYSSGGCPQIALDAWGKFALTWPETMSAPPYTTFARFYDATGAALGGAFRVHGFTPHDFNPQVAISAQGIVVVWDTYGKAAVDKWAVYGQRYSAAGVPAGGPFQISTTGTPANANISVAMAADGGFTVAYDDGTTGWPPSSVSQFFVRSYAPDGVALGPPASVTGITGKAQMNPFVALDSEGNSLVAWTQWETSTEVDVYARRFLPAGVSAVPVSNPGFVTAISGSIGGWRYFKVSVPSGHTTFDAFISGSMGDADLYLRHGALPTLSRWDGRPYLDGSNEGASMLRFPPGDWYLGIHGFTSYDGVSLDVMSY